MSPTFHLELIDEDDPTSAYRAVVNPSGHVDRRQFAENMISKGLQADVETVLALFDVEQAAIASLMWEGWDVATPDDVIAQTPWPDPALSGLLGGTLSGRPVANGEYVIERMMKLGVIPSRSQIEAFFAAQEEALADLLSNGYWVEHPLSWIYPIIEGVFHSPDDEFDPQQHHLSIKHDEETDITDWLKGYRELERRGLGDVPRPLLDSFDDVHTGQSGQQVSPGHMVRLRGYWLRFQKSDQRQGIFLNAEDGATRRVQSVACTGLCNAAFVWPRDLPPGNYWLELRTIIVPRDGLQRTMWPRPILVVAET
jgi:hypothetical protein